MKTYIYIDHSNLLIEGQRVSAVSQGVVRSIRESDSSGITDWSWRFDFRRLLEFICGTKGERGWAKIWGSRPPGDPYWQALRRSGFDVRTFERSFGKERKVDVALAYEIGKDLASIDKKTSGIVLITGDKDFEPVVEDFVDQGFNVSVAFWQHAAEGLKRSATEFLALDPWLAYLTKTEGQFTPRIHSAGYCARS